VVRVHARAGTFANCGGVAAAVLDFEPADAFAFVRDLDPALGDVDPDLLDSCATHVELGVREALTSLDGKLPGVRVVLRWVLTHPIDFSESANRAAGRQAVAQAGL
jgi:hypothetical protein